MVSSIEPRGAGNTAAASSGAQGAEGAAAKTGKHSRGLLLIGLFKLSKTIFFTCVGIGALHLVHRDLGDLIMRISDRLSEMLRIDTEGHLVSMLMDKADQIDSHRLRQAGMFAFAYAAVCLVEGMGLVLEKGWAEYVTVVVTAAGLPWEIYELFDHYTPYKVLLMLVNLAVLLYLLWYLKRKRGLAERNGSTRLT